MHECRQHRNQRVGYTDNEQGRRRSLHLAGDRTAMLRGTGGRPRDFRRKHQPSAQFYRGPSEFFQEISPTSSSLRFINQGDGNGDPEKVH